jgi:hypothetical protein
LNSARRVSNGKMDREGRRDEGRPCVGKRLLRTQLLSFGGYASNKGKAISPMLRTQQRGIRLETGVDRAGVGHDLLGYCALISPNSQELKA